MYYALFNNDSKELKYGGSICHSLFRFPILNLRLIMCHMQDYSWVWWLLLIGGGIWLVAKALSLSSEKDELERRNGNLSDTNSKLQSENDAWRSRESNLKFREDEVEESTKTLQQLYAERVKNFPLLGEVWADLIEKTETEHANALRYKKRPALTAAAEVSKVKQEKKALAKELNEWKYRAKNYEAVAPWLLDDLKEDIENEVQSQEYFKVYDDSEREDPVTNFISPDDYRKLSHTDRNQLALERYWSRGKKTKWMVGMMYERYIGYFYETNGWKVEFFGIKKRYEDLGRDLIAIKGDKVHVVQCKNWASYKSIYENAIFQLFGTAYSMRKNYPNKQVIPVFFTTTTLSDTAAEFAKLLKIEVKSEFKFKEYPAIKCNISSNGTRIYHLPFDQKYDLIQITPKTGEFYTNSVAEAEKQGFRRAFRWRGVKR